MSVVLVFPRATPRLVRPLVGPDARVLAIDGGADVLHTLGVVPEAVIGDMDSVDPDTLAHMRAQGARIEEHPVRKRDTDAALALRQIEDEDDIVFVGSGGGRADHAWANLHLLAACQGRARAVDEDARTWVATPARPLALDVQPGRIVSVLPFDTTCTGVHLVGFEYDLEDATMHAGDPYGISNVAKAPRQLVRVGTGRLLVIEPSDLSHA